MTNRTSTQKVKEKLAVNMEHSILSFKVLARTSDRPKVDTYVVAVPMAVAYNGFRTRFSKVHPMWFKTTKFGDDLARTVNGIKGVELWLDNSHPHVIHVFAYTKAMEDASPHEIFHAWTQSMPLVIIEAIEEVILRNQDVDQRFAEWLRRLF